MREIPDALFCSSCLRVPADADAVIPESYLAVSSPWYDEWLRRLAPDVILYCERTSPAAGAAPAGDRRA